MASRFVFGYGSLAAVGAGAGAGQPARLRGYRRVWGVAMDNSVTIPGYKTYRRREDGIRPAVYVAFLDLVADPDAVTEGALLAVDDAALLALDERERNYDRIDVTAQLDGAPGTVWAYCGSPAGRARLRHGVERGSAVVDSAYLQAVREAFATLGIEDDADPGPLPVVGLDRLDLPAAP